MTEPVLKDRLRLEVRKRRTFGIISHPDAGKTTLTEKFLLFGGAIQQAGAVKAKKAARHARSDWMQVEQQRGISVSSSVMQFDFRGCQINLLDTPGHQDFSEDTYRVLTAVDSALMVIDSVKGVESQTRKLMQVCRMRSIPILTFINKLDRDGRDPIELLDEIEASLGLQAVPMTWPIGMGKGFKGVYDLKEKALRFFDPNTKKGSRTNKVLELKDLNDPRLVEAIGPTAAKDLVQDVELLAGAGATFSHQAYLKGEQTPVFFGSAVNNFGVQELLDNLVSLAPGPRQRQAQTRLVEPEEPEFSGVVFKIQANMDPNHRDRIAFVRVCSGRFEPGMRVHHQRLKKDISLSKAIIFMARDRAGTSEAWPGDIIGLPNHGTLKIGDTLTAKERLRFLGIPNFAPELFQRVILRDPLRSKQLEKGLIQLSEEGAIQFFRRVNGRELILGAIGALQFDITAGRLKTEYNVQASYEPLRVYAVRWLEAKDDKVLQQAHKEFQDALVEDGQGARAVFFSSSWRLEKAVEDWPQIEFKRIKEH
jgi:peptide chain release factor 3